jgi:two-component system response regulator HydG
MAKPIEILVVDDSSDAVEIVSAEMREAGYRVRTAGDGRAAWQQFRTRRPDLVISDIRMPHETGIDLLRRVRGISDVPVILLTAYAEVSLAVAALREGATDFVRFPEEVPELRGRVRALLPDRTVPEPDDAACEELPGDAAGMRELRTRVRALAALDVPVLVSGEPGTGRLATVRALHALSGETAPLVTAGAPTFELPKKRCAAVLIALEEWPSEAQDLWAKTLRVDAGAEIARLYAIGGPSLAARVERLEIRRDLWLRLSRFRIDVPPLRARSEDVPMFARAALSEIATSLGRGGIAFTPGALDSLRRRPWRGNLPELRDVLFQAAAFADGPKIDRSEVERAVEAVIAAREDSLAHRRAEKTRADREQLIRLLSSCRGNIAEIARQLGMTRGAVSYRLRRHGLSR